MSKMKVTISEVLSLLAEGKKRPEIAEHFGITMADCRRLFNHPKLKGKKALKQIDFELVDDTIVEEAPVNESPEEEIIGELTEGMAEEQVVESSEEETLEAELPKKELPIFSN